MYGTLPDTLIALLRHLLTFIAGIVVARGWISADMAAQLVGALIGLIGLAFSAFFHAGSNGTIPTQSTTPSMAKQIEDKTITQIAPAVPAVQ